MVTVIGNDRGNPNVLVATAHYKYSLLIYNSDLNQTKVLCVLCIKRLFTFYIYHLVEAITRPEMVNRCNIQKSRKENYENFMLS